MNASAPWWRHPRARLFALLALMWLIAAGVLAAAVTVLLPFEIALLLAFVINPVITRLTRLRIGRWYMPRFVAVVLVYIFIGFVMWFASVAILPQIYAEAIRGLADLSETVTQLGPAHIRAAAERIQSYLTRYGVPVELVPGGAGEAPHFSVDLAAVIADSLGRAAEWVKVNLGNLVGVSRALLAGTVRAIFFFILLLMVTAFVLVDAPRILAWTETLVPHAWRGEWVRLLGMVDRGLAGVVRGQLTICVINGILTLIGLLILKIPFPYALSALAMVLYLVPLFGTIISSIPIVLLGLSAGGLKMGFAALLWIIAIHALETYVLNPKIMGDASKIHPVLIVLALVIGEHHFGIVGALLAVPVASVVASIFKFVQSKAEEQELQLVVPAPMQAPLVPPVPPAPPPSSSPPAPPAREP